MKSILFLKATQKKKVWISQYTRGDGEVVEGHYQDVHVTTDHDVKKVASGGISSSQKFAHKKLSKEKWFGDLQDEHKAGHVMRVATELQDAKSHASNIATFKKKVLSGGRPSKVELSSFYSLTEEKKKAIRDEAAAMKMTDHFDMVTAIEKEKKLAQSYNKMIIKDGGVYKLKQGQTGTPTDMAGNKRYWFLPVYAKPLFTGTQKEAEEYIQKQGAEYVHYDAGKVESEEEAQSKSTKEPVILLQAKKELEKRDSPSGNMEFKSATGKIINLSFDLETGVYHVDVPELDKHWKDKNLRITELKQGNKITPALYFGEISVGIPDSMVTDVRKWIIRQGEMARVKKEAAIEKAVPGYQQLKDAVSKLHIAIDVNDKYMERGHETSIFSGDSGNPEKAQEIVDGLVNKYPKAAAYLNWSSSNAMSSSGYAKLRAAEALLAGKSLEEAKKIADDWNNWD